MYERIIFFAIISTACAALFDGPCPEVKPVDYLNITAYAGSTWYEVARYPNDVEKKGDCAIMTFKNVTDDVTFTLTDIVDKKPNKIRGKVEFAPNAGTTGILNFISQSFEATEGTKTLPIYIVAIDLDSYFIGYECSYYEKINKKHVYAWIKSRTKTLDGGAKAAVDKFVQSAPYLDASLFYWDKFDDAVCNVKA